MKEVGKHLAFRRGGLDEPKALQNFLHLETRREGDEFLNEQTNLIMQSPSVRQKLQKLRKLKERRQNEHAARLIRERAALQVQQQARIQHQPLQESLQSEFATQTNAGLGRPMPNSKLCSIDLLQRQFSTKLHQNQAFVGNREQMGQIVSRIQDMPLNCNSKAYLPPCQKNRA